MRTSRSCNCNVEFEQSKIGLMYKSSVWGPVSNGSILSLSLQFSKIFLKVVILSKRKSPPKPSDVLFRRSSRLPKFATQGSLFIYIFFPNFCTQQASLLSLSPNLHYGTLNREVFPFCM